jgi:hypothetical protein
MRVVVVETVLEAARADLRAARRRECLGVSSSAAFSEERDAKEFRPYIVN